MLNMRHLPLLLVPVLLTGCLSTVRVKRDPLNNPELAALNDPNITEDFRTQTKNTNVKGIPFYVKVARCKQETAWLQPVYTLTLKKITKVAFKDEAKAKERAKDDNTPDKLKLPAAKTSISTKVLSLSDYPKTKDLRELLSKPGVRDLGELLQIDALWNDVLKLPTYEPLAQAEPATMVTANMSPISNTSTPDALVDYSRIYYLNSPRPWTGSSQVNIKIASDGTITEGSSQVQSQTVSTILSALPINSVLTAVAKSALAGSTAAELAAEDMVGPGYQPENASGDYETVTTTEVELTVQQENYKHTHTAFVKFSVPCQAAGDGVVKQPYALTIEMPGGAGAKKDEENTVKINGTVVLPKAKEASPTPPATSK